MTVTARESCARDVILNLLLMMLRLSHFHERTTVNLYLFLHGILNDTDPESSADVCPKVSPDNAA